MLTIVFVYFQIVYSLEWPRAKAIQWLLTKCTSCYKLIWCVQYFNLLL